MKPILFNSEMVRAILDGRKTMTRRIVKDPYYIDDEEVCRAMGFALRKGTNVTHGMPYPDSPYNVCDILYVRETWAIPYERGYFYAADYADEHDIVPADNGGVSVSKKLIRWHPSIHMPKEAARLFLRVTNVRIERLQEISSDDIDAEGVTIQDPYALNGEEKRYAFSVLWNSTVPKADISSFGWDANPWVWVVDFERVEIAEV